MKKTRTSAPKKAKEIAKLLRSEQPGYNYLKSVFRYLREELEISVPKEGKKLPSVPTSEEMQRATTKLFGKLATYRIWY